MIQELNEDDIVSKCRHYSTLNREMIHLYYNNETLGNALEIFNLNPSENLNMALILDNKQKSWYNIESIWNDFSGKLRNETKDMDIIFNF